MRTYISVRTIITNKPRYLFCWRFPNPKLLCERCSSGYPFIKKIPDGTKEEERQRRNIFLQLRLVHTARSLQRYKH